MDKYSGSRQAPKGLTLVELLVVIAIVAVVSGLTASIVPRVIARSQLTLCMNNAYQIANALQAYDERCGAVPGWLNKNPNGTTGACSWPVPLLPFIGRQDLSDAWPGICLTSTSLPSIDIYTCPSNRPDKNSAYPPVHYACNVGYSGTSANDGVFLNLSGSSPGTLSLDDVSEADGTSTTLAFAEKSSPWFPLSQPHTWAYPEKSDPANTPFVSGMYPLRTMPPVFGVSDNVILWDTSWGRGTMLVKDTDIFIRPQTNPLLFNRHPRGKYDLGRIDTRIDTRFFAPASPHLGGVVVAFCDGHTMFLKNSIPYYVYGQLLTPKSRWGSRSASNSAAMQPWLLKDNQPYLLDEKILKQ